MRCRCARIIYRLGSQLRGLVHCKLLAVVELDFAVPGH